MTTPFLHSTLVLLVLLQLALIGVQSWRSFSLPFNALSCSQRSDLVSYVNCSLHRGHRQRQKGIFFNFEFAQTVTKVNFDLCILLVRPREPDFVVFNGTKIDGCQFLEDKLGFTVVRIIRKQLEKFARLPAKCPVAKGASVSVSNFILDPDSFPPYTPETKYSAHMVLWSNVTPMLELTVNGSCVQKEAKKKS